MDTGYESFNNRDELARARVAGCFSCLGTFSPEDIVLWLHEDTTAAYPAGTVDNNFDPFFNPTAAQKPVATSIDPFGGIDPFA